MVRVNESPILTVSSLYPNKDYEVCVDEIFTHLTLDDQPNELINIRKKQIVNHSCCDVLVDAFEGIVGLIGERDNQENNVMFNTFYNLLVEYHSPVYPNMYHNDGSYTGFVIGDADEDDDYILWSFTDLYGYYLDLCLSKGWDDFYVCSSDNPIPKYMALDMLNDLVVHSMIKTYDVSDFINDFLEEWDDAVDVTGDMFFVVML